MKAIKVISTILLILALFITVINVIPPKKNTESNPFVVGEGELPMIAAHRGGGDNNPENTMLAFREAVNTYKVDIIESDLYLTKDGYLVYNHDGYIDRTSNANGDISYDEMKELIRNKENRHYIEDMTLEELRQFNFGYYFEDESGERHLYIINSANTEATVSVSLPTDEYSLPMISAFTESDGATLLGMGEENGKTVLSCRLSPQGYGKIVWSKGDRA